MPSARAPEPRQTLDPDRVAEWLAQHTDFFVGREGLLQQLKVPHPHIPGAVSLLERLVLDLRRRAEDAEWRLENLLESARYNEAQYRRTRELVLGLIEAEDADSLAQALATQLSERFRTQAIGLWLEAEPESHAAPRHPADWQPPRFVLTDDARQRLELLLNEQTSRCTTLDRDEWQALLPQCEAPAASGSCAITRLTQGESLGYLILASHDGEHFRATLDTLFTEYLGEVVSRLLKRAEGPRAGRA
ncbi:hypothetical protein GCM10009038_07620 [Salinicola rhizosphaerae]|uniref:DUF484 family protein n=1 Tax=Salinicola rhizosphaerae TaxID=1443141 RepID=A0ABQ3DS12_9GAMM|nr:DUF484 family protein [Salinicola rhizosphaerae]GHB12328.1 hypothetical protein GCM10009038_07620 [Salinicola rhizosphaerae]